MLTPEATTKKTIVQVVKSLTAKFKANTATFEDARELREFLALLNKPSESELAHTKNEVAKLWQELTNLRTQVEVARKLLPQR